MKLVLSHPAMAALACSAGLAHADIGKLLLNATLRSTNANQNGLLGFGAAAPCSPSSQPPTC